VLTLPETSNFAAALEGLFSELNGKWLESAPLRQVVTDERVLRELSLPPDAETRLCYFAVPTSLLSLYRESVFPLVDEVGLVAASGDEVTSPEGNLRALLDSLLQRAHAVVGDVSGGDTRVWNEIRAASQRSRPPRIAIVSEEGQQLESPLLPSATIFFRPPLPTAAAAPVASDNILEELGLTWLDSLANWLEQIAAGASTRLEVEAVRLLDQRMYRPAVIAVASALEVALRDRLQRWGPTAAAEPRPSKRASPIGQLLDEAQAEALITPEERAELWELQRTRNVLVHTADPIHGQRARSLVRHTTKIISRLRDNQ
jgi:hypothetical protein